MSGDDARGSTGLMASLEVSDVELMRAFDPMTVARGARYAREGRVSNLHVDSDGDDLAVSATVRGGSRWPYATTVWVGARLASECTCPVARNCKHGVAVLQTVRAAVSSRPVQRLPAWRRTLDDVLHGLEQEPVPTARRKIALEIDLSAPQWPTRAQTLLLRPLRTGKRGNWIKTGITWADAQVPEFDTAHDPEQMQVVTALARAHRQPLGREAAPLSGFGPPLHHLLEEAEKAGIPLLPGRSLTSVERLDIPLDLVLDAVRDAAGSRLRVGAWHDGFVTGDQLQLLGAPPHGVALLGPTDGGLHVRLARLRRRPPEAVLRLQGSGDALEVPADDTDEFFTDYLPRLRQGIEVISTDGSVDLPEEVPARLQVALTWQGLEAHLQWQWRYGEHGFALDDPDPAHAVRRPRAERRLLAASAQWSDLQPSARLSPVETLRFVEDELAALRADEAFDVVEVGRRPEFREATGDPEIEFVAGQDSTDWLDLSVQITVDDVAVPLADVLAALTAGDERILLPTGLVVSVDRPEFARLAELVTAAAELEQGDRDNLRVAHADLGLWEQLAELGVVDVQAARWVEAARALVHHTALPEVALRDLVSKPRDYQVQGIRWLVLLWQLGLGGVLADDMGLGKTLQTLALVDHARSHGAAPFLVVAPTSVVSAWATEAARHTPGLDVRTVTASQARRGTTLAAEVDGADLVVTSYTLLRLEADDYAALTWGGQVLDEAQTVKNHQSKTYRAVRLVDAPFRLAVTGTPFENRLMELWSLLSIVAPGLYPWPKRFTELVARPVEKHGDQRALERFKARVRPFVLRRTKELVARELPEKQEQVLDVTLGTRHRKVYDTWLQKERQSILGLVDDFDRNRVAIFSALTRLRQLSLDPGLVDEAHADVGSAKTEALVEHLCEVVAEGHRALVFSQFTGYLHRVRAALESAGVSCRYLDGATRDRAREIDAFRAGAGDVFLISLKAGGVGLTLTEADYVFVLDPWWNPAAEAQAVDRAHRIGQQRPVMVYRLVSTGTIEEKVMALKERKAALFSSVFSGEGAVGTGIDADDVRALFS